MWELMLCGWAWWVLRVRWSVGRIRKEKGRGMEGGKKGIFDE